jgi:ABC-type phosphate/phosphonate transport system substrate-binding protein
MTCKSWFLVLIILSNLPASIFAQKELTVGLMNHNQKVHDQEAIIQFYEGMIRYIKSRDSSFNYSAINYVQIKYVDPPEELLNGRSILVTLTPLKYMIIQEEHHANLIPLFVTKKRSEKVPYYPSIFIANKNSRINSLNSTAIRRVYCVKYSASGYLAPIYKLFEKGIISSPNKKGINNKGWELGELLSHGELVEKIRSDTNAIGAAWNFENWDNPVAAEVKPILRYNCYPQDPFVISPDLRKYETYIKQWLTDSTQENLSIRKEFFSVASISGLEPYSLEHHNGYTEMYDNYRTMTQFDDNVSAKKREFKTLILQLTAICCTLAILIIVLAYKANKATGKIKVRYSSIMWGALTAIILVGIEILRLYVEEYSHSIKFLNEHYQVVMITAGILLASISEFKLKMARMISAVLKKINEVLKVIADVFSNDEARVGER